MFFQLCVKIKTYKRIKMSDFFLILAGQKAYPSIRQINEASNYAEEITTGYVRKIDPLASVTFEEGDVDINSSCDFKGLAISAQCIFDYAFAYKIQKFQAGA